MNGLKEHLTVLKMHTNTKVLSYELQCSHFKLSCIECVTDFKTSWLKLGIESGKYFI